MPRDWTLDDINERYGVALLQILFRNNFFRNEVLGLSQVQVSSSKLKGKLLQETLILQHRFGIRSENIVGK